MGSLRISAALFLLWPPFACSAAQQIPIGFKIEHYRRLFERNPFTPVMPAAPEVHGNPFAKLFLVSWFKEGDKMVVLVQDSESKEVQTIGAAPNPNRRPSHLAFGLKRALAGQRAKATASRSRTRT